MNPDDIALLNRTRGGIGRALVARLRARGLRVAAVMDRLLSPAAARLRGQVIVVDRGFATVRPPVA